MDKRFFVFLFLASLALMVNAYVVNWLNPPAPAKPKVAQNKPLDEAQQDKDQGDALAAKDEEKEPQAPAAEAPRQPAEEPQQDHEQGDPQQDIKLQHVTIGSVDP